MSTTSPRRIALALESDGPGGAETMLMQLAEELRRRGHHVVPVGPATGCGWLAAEFRKRGFSPETFLLRRPLDPGCLAGLVRLYRDRRIDVVHSHEFTMAVYGAAASRVLGLPHVVTMHGGQTALRAARRRVALRLAFRLSRSVVAVSETLRDEITAALGIAQAAVSVIPNGIRFAPGDGARVRAELGLRPGELLVLSVGRLVDLKGHEILLRACAALAREDTGTAWRVVIAGRGEREEHLRSVVAELGQEARVRLLGHRDDVAALLAAADVFVLPSLFEGLPVAVLEAMFAGKPVLASAISGVPDALDHGRAGLLVPPADVDALARGLQTLLTSSALRERLGRAGQARAAAHYSVARMVDRYEEAYGFTPGVAPRDTAHQAHAALPDGPPPTASGADGELHVRSAGSAERA